VIALTIVTARLLQSLACLFLAVLAAAQQGPPAGVDPETLIKQVSANQKQLEIARKNYIFHRRDEQQDADESGKVKKTTVTEYEVFFVGPWQIERLLAKNGKPLTESEKKKEDDNVAKQEKKARERIQREESGEEPEKDTFTPAKFLAADRFFNLRRDTLNGHEVYAFDFEPRADFKPHNLTEKVLQSLGGTLWIDEQAKQPVRLEAHLLDGMKLMGGVVGSVKKGATIVFEEQKVNDEVWMPSYGEVHLDYRLFFRRNVQNIVLRYSEYRKFKVDSKITGFQETEPPR
jgi:hypothetical protein